MRPQKTFLLALPILFGQGVAAQPLRPATNPVAAAAAAPAPKVTTGRWQLGVQLVYQQFNGLAQASGDNGYYGTNTQSDLSDDGTLRFAGPQATVSYLLTPRLALETGLGFSSTAWHTKLQPSLIPEWWLWSKYQVRSTNWVVPLRVRYELRQLATKRFSCAVLAGVQLIQQNTRYRPESSAATPDPADSGWSIHRDLPLTLGLGVRYQVAKHWALTADGQLNASPRFLFGSTAQVVNAGIPGVGTALGLRYCF